MKKSLISLGVSQIVLIIALTLVHQVAAVKYDDAGSNSWDSSSIKRVLNNEYKTNVVFGTTGIDYIDNVELVSSNEWGSEVGEGVVVKNKYKQVINSGAYLPDGIDNTWTKTPVNGTTTNAYSIEKTSGNTVSTNVTTDYTALPLIELKDNVCANGDDGGTGALGTPYTLTNVGCNTPPVIETVGTDNLTYTVSDGIRMTGTVSDKDNGQIITVAATINGVTVSQPVTAVSSGGVATPVPFELHWTSQQLLESNITSQTIAANTVAITAKDSYNAEAESKNYLGSILIDVTPPTCGQWQAYNPRSTETVEENKWLGNIENVAAGNNASDLVYWQSVAQQFRLTGTTDGNTAGGGVSGLKSDNPTGCTVDATNGDTYCSFDIYDVAGNQTTCNSPQGKYDPKSPAIDCTLSAASNGYIDNGDKRLFYRGNTNGSFTWTVSLQEEAGPSGVSSVDFATIGTGFSKTANGTYASNYTWASGAQTESADNTATITYGNGLTQECSVMVYEDSAEPTGGVLNYTAGYITELPHNFDLNATTLEDAATGSNPASQLDESTLKVYRSEATLTNDSCGTFSSPWTDEVTHTVSDGRIYDTSTKTQGKCYKWQLSIADNAGNLHQTSSDAVVKVNTDKADTELESVTGERIFKSGNDIYYRRADEGSSATFTLNVKATDPNGYVGVRSVTFPGISSDKGFTSPNTEQEVTNRTSDVFSQTYTYGNDATGNISGLKLHSTNNSNVNSEDVTFNLIADNTAPANPRIVDLPTTETTYIKDDSFTITGSADVDAGSGNNTTNSYVEESTGTISGGVCTWSDNWSHAGSVGNTIAHSDIPENTVACYRYRYHAEDMVGNVSVSPVVEVIVDRQKPVCGAWDPEQATWKSSGGQTFRLPNATDNDGSGLTGSNYQCTTGSNYGDQCVPVLTLTDKAGNTQECPSPINRVDSQEPDLSVTEAKNTWQVTRQELKVIATDSETNASGLSRVAYSWTGDLSDDCRTGGVEITSDPNLQTTGADISDSIVGSAHGSQLVVCARDNAGNIRKNTQTFYFTERPVIEITTSTSTPLIPKKNGAAAVLQGKINYPYQTDNLYVQATVYDVTKTVKVDTRSGSGSYDWRLSWSYNDFNAKSASKTITSIDVGAYDTGKKVDGSVNLTAVTATYNGEFIVDRDKPVCGNDWQPDPADVDWTTATEQEFTLSGITDIGGSGLDGASTRSCIVQGNGANCDFVIRDNAGNTETCYSPSAKIDDSNPTSTCSITDVVNGYAKGNSVFFNGSKAGSFTWSINLDTPPSGVASVDFPAVGSSPNESDSVWNEGKTITNDDSGSYSAVYSWSENATATAGDKTMVVTYGNNETNDCSIKIYEDSTPPEGGNLGYEDGKDLVSTENPGINLGFTPPTDGGGESGIPSGTDDSSIKFYFRETPLVDGVCSEFTDDWQDVTSSVDVSNGTYVAHNSPFNENTCIQYKATVQDDAGNMTEIVGGTMKVDTSTPKVSVSQVGAVDTGSDSGNLHVVGTKLYYKPGTSGTFDVTVGANSNTTKVSDVTFAKINQTGFGPDSDQVKSYNASDNYTATYSFDESAVSDATINITRHNVDTTELTTTMSVYADSAAPANPRVAGFSSSQPTYVKESSFTVIGMADADTGSGNNPANSYLEESTGTLSGGACTNWSETWNHDSNVNNTITHASIPENTVKCYRYRYHAEDMVGNVSVSPVVEIIVDRQLPTCGEWDPTAAEVPWIASGEQTFRLPYATDNAGSGLTGSNYSCTTDNALTCSIELKDVAGNERRCTSPAKRVDSGAPEVELTPAVDQWLEQAPVVKATITEEGSGIERMAYAWSTDTSISMDEAVGSDCSKGTAFTDTNLDLGQFAPEEESRLWVCAIDAVGNVGSAYDNYKWRQKPSDPLIYDNVDESELSWNTKPVDNSSTLTIEGEIPATDIVKEYEVILKLNGVTDYTPSVTVTTSTTQPVKYTIDIDPTKFGATEGNYAFSGPHTLIIRDPVSGQETTAQVNISFYFPLYNTNHRVNGQGMFIYVEDTRTNPMPE